MESLRIPVPAAKLASIENDWKNIAVEIINTAGVAPELCRLDGEEAVIIEGVKDEAIRKKISTFFKAFMLGYPLNDCASLLGLLRPRRLHSLGVNSTRVINNAKGRLYKQKNKIESLTRARILISDDDVHILGHEYAVELALEEIYKIGTLRTWAEGHKSSDQNPGLPYTSARGSSVYNPGPPSTSSSDQHPGASGRSSCVHDPDPLSPSSSDQNPGLPYTSARGSSAYNPGPPSTSSSDQHPGASGRSGCVHDPDPLSASSSDQNPGLQSTSARGSSVHNPGPSSTSSSGQYPGASVRSSSVHDPDPLSASSSGHDPGLPSSSSRGSSVHNPGPPSTSSSGQNPGASGRRSSVHNPDAPSASSSGQDPEPLSTTGPDKTNEEDEQPCTSRQGGANRRRHGRRSQRRN